MNLLMTQDEVKVFLHGEDARQAVHQVKRMRNIEDPVSVQNNTRIDITIQFSEKSIAKRVARMIETWHEAGAPWEH